MKFFALLLLATSAGLAADFTTGQAARLVIGQRSFTAQDQGVSDTLVGGVGGVAYAQNNLFVVDSNRVSADPINQRVLIFQNLASMLPGPTDYLYFFDECPVCLGTASVVLGQPDFSTTTLVYPPVVTSLRAPTAVASDGRILAVADTDNNRVLIWKSIPTVNQAPPDIVLGQADFKSNSVTKPPSAKSLRGPQGVWIQGQRFFVADTFNNRVLIWNSIPTSNGQAADVVLGQSDFSGFVQEDLSQTALDPQATNLLSPVSVTSDGQRVYVTDLGHNRVLIWNSIPTANRRPADVVVGQPNMTSATSNNTTELCPASGSELSISAATNAYPAEFTTSASHGLTTGQTVKISGATGKWDVFNGSFAVTVVSETAFSIGLDSSSFGALGGSLTVLGYPDLCNATLDFPRYALSDGQRLFIADGGNDRVLVYSQVPTANGQGAGAVLGQLSDSTNTNSDQADELRRASVDSLRTPTSLAWDGVNLYVADPFDRRIMVFSAGENSIPIAGVRNNASRSIHSVGSISFSGSIQADDKVTVTIGDSTDAEVKVEYVYKVVGDDTLESVAAAFVALINAGSGDSRVYATANVQVAALLLTARAEGPAGDNVTLATTFSDSAKIAATASATLSGGKDAAKIAPGTLVEINGVNLADQTVSAPDGMDPLSTDIGGVEVYFNGIRAPLLYVSPTQIKAQIPWEVSESTSVSAFIRVQWKDGHVTATTPVGVPIVPQNPGIFALEGQDPRPAVVLHSSSYATGTISFDGAAAPGDKLGIKIDDRLYNYTVQEADTLVSIRNAFVSLINFDPMVEASPSGFYSRLRLKARIPGPEGNRIKFSVSTPEGASAILTPFNESLCCANEAGSLVTEDNPALPGETILVYATGLGAVRPDDAQQLAVTGASYTGPAVNDPIESVSSLAGGKTANVLSAGLKPGAIGIYEVALELNSGQPTDPLTQLTIAQNIYVSNIVVVPVYNPNPAVQ